MTVTTSTEHKPTTSSDGWLTLCCHGETILNYETLRKTLDGTKSRVPF